MARVIYSENKITDFIEEAKIRGIAPAIRHLGYPSFPTAQNWFKERGIPTPSVDSLMQKAAELRVFYGDTEKKYALQVLMERIVEMAQEDVVDADGINKLANAMSKLIQSYQLVEGKATAVSEQHVKTGEDLAIADMLNSMKAKNALKESELT